MYIIKICVQHSRIITIIIEYKLLNITSYDREERPLGLGEVGFNFI